MKENYKSYASFVLKHATEKNLLSYVRRTQEKIKQGVVEGILDNQKVKSKHFANSVIKMRENVSLSHRDFQVKGKYLLHWLSCFYF